MISKANKHKIAYISIGTLILVGVGFGTAAATPTLIDDHRETAVSQQQPPTQTSNIFKVNSRGQTFGSIAQDQVAEPDLILAKATNGKIGYVNNVELKVATGHPSLFKSPEEALKWQAAQNNRAVSVPVYEDDGMTTIGEFVIAPTPTGTPQ
ncbi:hypothetical protein [Paenarthrobacter histidinolovorans]|uniref:Uncharacterized protein n=1 Tax=Paenarthrobacter histidinolovorans TaxID=43664 RepID=A0ABW8N3L5_9MICC